MQLGCPGGEHGDEVADLCLEGICRLRHCRLAGRGGGGLQSFLLGGQVRGALHAVPEHLDGCGHSADLVLPPCPVDGRIQIARGDAGHCLAQAFQGTGDAAGDPPGQRGHGDDAGQHDCGHPEREGAEGGLDIVGVGPGRDQEAEFRLGDRIAELAHELGLSGAGIEVGEDGVAVVLDAGEVFADDLDAGGLRVDPVLTDQFRVGMGEDHAFEGEEGDVVLAAAELH